MRPAEAWVPFDGHGEAGRLVVVEGDPGAGKTSAIASAAWHNDVTVVPELDHVTDALGHCHFDSKYPEDWYLDRERARQAEIRQFLRSGRLVLQDRCVLSTMAFVCASAIHRHETSRVRRFLRRLAKGEKLVQPDAVVIMRVDVDVGLARRSSRERDQYRIWFDRDFLTRFQAFYRLIAPRVLRCPTTVIDTSALPQHSTVEVLRL